MLRILRMLRLMKSWKGLYNICMTFVKALPQMVNLFILTFLILVIFSLLGMQVRCTHRVRAAIFHTHEHARVAWPATPPKRIWSLIRCKSLPAAAAAPQARVKVRSSADLLLIAPSALAADVWRCVQRGGGVRPWW